MKKLVALLVVLFCAPTFLSAQDDADDAYVMIELTFMTCKKGMDAEFQKAVHAHNKKFHPEGPYQAGLWVIETGADAGAYIWTMGPVTYTQLDDAPGKGDHAEDWKKNVGIYVESYGGVEYWSMNTKLSVWDDEPDKMFMSMVVGIEEGKYHDFKAFIEKTSAIHKKHSDKEWKVWSNNFWGADNRHFALNFYMDSWADFDNEEYKMTDEYDAEYGEGAWERALDDWREITIPVSRTVWRAIPPPSK